MNKTIKEQIEVMQYYANGGEVEFKHLQGNKEEWQLKTNIMIGFDWSDKDYRIKEQRKTIIIEKWLCTNEFGDYFAVEIGKNNVGECKKVRLIESYRVEL